MPVEAGIVSFIELAHAFNGGVRLKVNIVGNIEDALFYLAVVEDVFPEYLNFTLLRLVNSGNSFEKSGFSRSVIADQTVYR